MIVENLNCIKESQQVILVTTQDYDQITAKLETFEKVGENWKRVFLPMEAVIGRKGFTNNKVEGDGKSPIGIFTLGLCFGKNKNPGTNLAYRQTTENDAWVDDVDSVFYNTWQVEPALGRWKSAEKLRPKESYYDLGIVINYNTQDRIPGKGSAIFFHVWQGENIGTAGCTAVSYENMLRIVRWLDPSKKSLLIQGPLEEMAELTFE